MRGILAGLALGLAAGLAAAQQAVQVERANLDGAEVALFLHPFLTAEELATLRVVMTSKDALALFVPAGKGYAALAVAPREGFVRNGMPVDSAQALGGAASAQAAAEGARAECDRLKKRGPACVTVLEVAAP